VDAQTVARANDRFNATEKDVATPRQMTLLVEKILKGEIVDRASSDEIIEFMNHSMIGQTRLPALLPDGTRVVHKTGSISGSTNDTGIVFLPGGGHLIITIFTKDAKAPNADREHVLAETARFAYDYFVFNPTGR
jgi:beta-lactamase class A